MTARPFTTALRVAALSAAWLLQAPAQAGLVSGNWDPAFGPALPGMSWAVHAELLVPNACAEQAGSQDLTGACAGSSLLGVFLRLYNSTEGAPDWSDPLGSAYTSSFPVASAYALCASAVAGDPSFIDRCGNDFSGDGAFNLRGLRIEGGSVAGLDADLLTAFITLVDFGAGPQSQPSSAQGNEFSLGFTLNGPQLTCITCPGGPVLSQTDGLRQFIVTYTSDDTTTPKYTDSAGNALGVRLDQNGRVLGLSTSIDGALQAVPEPGSLALVAGALAAAALLRRRAR